MESDSEGGKGGNGGKIVKPLLALLNVLLLSLVMVLDVLFGRGDFLQSQAGTHDSDFHFFILHGGGSRPVFFNLLKILHMPFWLGSESARQNQ